MSDRLILYNTLTRAKEPFRPIDPRNVRMYVCGPTVYDFAHIGNARPAIVFDVLFRVLRHLYGAEHVTYVRNVTDVDDKINARAARDFPDLPLNEAIRRVTETTARQYHADVAALGCLPPTHEPRATDFVLPRADGRADMASLIQRLIDRGHAYTAAGEILFDTRSMRDYGALSRRPLEEQQAGARVAVEAHKRHPADFVLWKQSGESEPGWDASFTVEGRPLAIRGRPGWHIECSAMSAAFLGEVFDIHGGGLDLIFPHHENEIAQSRCAHGTREMAHTWLHNGFLQVEGRKMSKSEGNFVTIHDLLHTERFGGRRWPGEVLRLAMLMTHYREPIDWSVRKLEEASDLLTKWRRTIAESNLATDTTVPGRVRESLLAPLCDELDTPAAVARIHKDHAFARRERGESDIREITAFAASLTLLGFDPLSWVDAAQHTLSSDLRTTLPHHIETRLNFIRDKNWAEADRIRDELLARGVQLKDGKDPTTGERVTTWEVRR